MLFGATLPILPWLRSHGATFVYGVHDIRQHPGERTGLEQAAAQFGLIQRADKLVTLSQDMKSELIKRYPNKSGRISVEPLAGIYECTSTPREFPKERALRLLVPGRLVRYKGFERLAQALQLLGSDICRVTIAGEGPERGYVARLFASLPTVDLRLGWMPDNDRRRLFEEHDVLVCAHDEASQSGLICEALTWALPSIVTPVGALPEQIEFGKAGWVARDTSPAALAEIITQVARDPIGYDAASSQCAAVLQRARLPSSWGQTLGLE
jgi:glycosyltransferase involved in cell wall biosynthesis